MRNRNRNRMCFKVSRTQFYDSPINSSYVNIAVRFVSLDAAKTLRRKRYNCAGRKMTSKGFPTLKFYILNSFFHNYQQSFCCRFIETYRITYANISIDLFLFTHKMPKVKRLYRKTNIYQALGNKACLLL